MNLLYSFLSSHLWKLPPESSGNPLTACSRPYSGKISLTACSQIPFSSPGTSWKLALPQLAKRKTPCPFTQAKRILLSKTIPRFSPQENIPLKSRKNHLLLCSPLTQKDEIPFSVTAFPALFSFHSSKPPNKSPITKDLCSLLKASSSPHSLQLPDDTLPCSLTVFSFSAEYISTCQASIGHQNH